MNLGMGLIGKIEGLIEMGGDKRWQVESHHIYCVYVWNIQGRSLTKNVPSICNCVWIIKIQCNGKTALVPTYPLNYAQRVVK